MQYNVCVAEHYHQNIPSVTNALSKGEIKKKLLYLGACTAPLLSGGPYDTFAGDA